MPKGGKGGSGTRLVTMPNKQGGNVDVQVDDSKWYELIARAYDLDKAHVKVGVLADRGDSQYITKRKNKATAAVSLGKNKKIDTVEHAGIKLVQLAAIHEFGNEHVPERSFIRSTFLTRRANELRATCAQLCKKVVTDGMTADRALALLGQWASKEVKATITEDGVKPPLAKTTIEAKGSSRPLLDTGQLRNSVSYAVVPEGDE